MSNPTLLLILLGAIIVVAVIIWLVRSRGNTAGRHLDTSVTAVGAATEAVEDLVDAVAHRTIESVAMPNPDKELPIATAAPELLDAALPANEVEAREEEAEQEQADAAPPARAKAAAKPAAKAAPKAAPKPKAEPKAEPGPKAEPKAAPKAKAAALLDIGVPAAVGAPDNLRQIKGIGPKLNTLLGDLGISRFDQIAAWSAADADKVDAHLGTFKGRIARDNWIAQAGFLAKGDVPGFEARFGKLDSPGNS